MKKLILLSLFVVFIALTTFFSSVLGKQYVLKEGESIIVNGNTIKLEGVSSDTSVVISVNGVTKACNKNVTYKISGIDIKVVDIFYYPRENGLSAATIEIYYSLGEGDSIIFNEKIVKLEGVSSTNQVVISVDGASMVFGKDQTKTLGGLDIKVVDIYYYPKEQGVSTATLDISKSITQVNKTCTDSDGGLDYYTKGTVSVCTFTDTGGACGGIVDFCSGNVLTEGYCEGTEGRSVR
jgi:hypothetical protein